MNHLLLMKHLFDEMKHRNLIIWQLSASITVEHQVVYLYVCINISQSDSTFDDAVI